MRPLPLIVTGLVAYALFLAAGAPATALAPPVHRASGGGATMTSATGTILAGEAAVDVRSPATGSIRIDLLRWQWRPLRLLAGELAFDVEANAAGLRIEAQVARSLGEWRLRDLRGGGDAAAIGSLYPMARAWQPAGTLALEASALAFDGKDLRGNASAEWRDATLSISTAQPLGSWRAAAAGDGGPAKLTLATVKGPLRLSGNGTLAANGRLAFSGEARPEAGREAELEPVLALIGPRRADGTRALDLR